MPRQQAGDGQWRKDGGICVSVVASWKVNFIVLRVRNGPLAKNSRVREPGYS